MADLVHPENDGDRIDRRKPTRDLSARRIAKLSAAAPLSVEALKFARHSVTARNLAVAHALKAEGHGIAVPRKMTRRAKAYVDHKIRKADRRAAPPR